MSSFLKIVRNSSGKIFYLILLLPLAWILSGFYSVDQNEIAIPVFFGKALQFKNAGIHFNIPYPMGDVYIADIKKSRTVSIGFGSLDYDGMSSNELSGTIISYTGNSKETLFVDTNIFNQQFMTGDENIIAIEMDVIFNISSPHKWFFNYLNPDELIASTAQKLLFSLISRSTIDKILVRDPALEFNLKNTLQAELDNLKCGVQISSITFKEVSLPVRNVENAYRDVKSAEDDRTRRIEDARREASITITQGKTEAKQIHDSAVIKGTEIKNRAFTEYELFTKMLKSRIIEDQIDFRLYMETIEKLLENNQTYLIEPIDSLDTIYINQDGE